MRGWNYTLSADWGQYENAETFARIRRPRGGHAAGARGELFYGGLDVEYPYVAAVKRIMHGVLARA